MSATDTIRHTCSRSDPVLKQPDLKKAGVQISMFGSKKLQRLEKQRRRSHTALHSDVGVRAWRKNAEMRKLHDIEHQQTIELNRLEEELKHKAGQKKDTTATVAEAAAAAFKNTSSNQGITGLEMFPLHDTTTKSTLNPIAETQPEPRTRSRTSIYKTDNTTNSFNGRATFRAAARKVKLQNSVMHLFDVTERRELSLEHHISEPHCHKSVGPLKIFLHFLNLIFIVLLSQALWTYDGLDAVEMIEDQILRGSQYDHFYAKYTDVDNHDSFEQYMPTLVNKIFSKVPIHKDAKGNVLAPTILRYKKKPVQELPCVNYRNRSLPMVGTENKYSSSYKTFRPLPNGGTSVGMAKGATVYLSDGFLIRQVRGKVKQGVFTPSKQAKHCGSKYIDPLADGDFREFTSGGLGLYMRYPSNQGYDLYFSSEDTMEHVTQVLENSTTCGWIDESTRAVMFVFTLTFFSDSDRLKQPPNVVLDENSALKAFGSFVDVSIKIVFDMPSNGLIRARHELTVIDNTSQQKKYVSLIMLTILNFGVLVIHLTDIIKIGKNYFKQWMHLIQLFALALFLIGLGCYFYADQRQIFYPFEPTKISTSESYGAYRCTSLFDVEENAQKSSTRIFFVLFSWYSVLEIWTTLHYLRVFPIIMIPLTALTSAALEILFFFIVFLIVVMGFGVGAHLNFGEVYEFRSIFHSVLTLLLVSVDELDSIDLFTGTQHGIYGQVFLYIFRMIAAVIFLNIFIVIVLVQYEIARSEKRLIVDEMHQLLLLWGCRFARLYGTCAACCSKKTTSEDYVTRFRKGYHDWRELQSNDAYPPLRHDTEVVMGEIHKLHREVDAFKKLLKQMVQVPSKKVRNG